MNDLTRLILASATAGGIALTGCGNEGTPSSPANEADPAAGHDDHAHNADDHAGHMGEEHHDEVDLGTVRIGDMDVELAQGHGALAPGKELHLVIKLPYSDSGASVVRAWLGTEDRFASVVAKAEYAASHDDYDVHAIAPDPLPETTMWWIEIEKPDGTKALGSAEPLAE